MTRRTAPILAMALLLAACDDTSGDATDEALYAQGQKAFERLCSSCHDAQTRAHRIGPHLVGLEGRPAGSVEAFDFSPAMRSFGATWDAKTLDTFLAAPLSAVPGTKMVIEPVTDAAQRAAVVYYLMRQ